MKKTLLALSLTSILVAASGYTSGEVPRCLKGLSWSVGVISCKNAPESEPCDQVVAIAPSITEGNYWTPCTGQRGACVNNTSATCYTPQPIEAPSCSNQMYLVNDCSNITSSSHLPPWPTLKPMQPTSTNVAISTPSTAQDLCNQSAEQNNNTGNNSGVSFMNMHECIWDTSNNVCHLNTPAGDGSFIMCSVVRPTPVLQHVATTKSGTLTG